MAAPTENDITWQDTKATPATGQKIPALDGANKRYIDPKEISSNDYTTAEKSKLAGVEDGATADQTGAEIKTAYEAEADTNAFTDAEQTKLSGIEAGADVTDEINVTAALGGSTLTDIGTPASDDKILIKDTSASGELKEASFSVFGGIAGQNVIYDSVSALKAASPPDAVGQIIYVGNMYKYEQVASASDILTANGLHFQALPNAAGEYYSEQLDWVVGSDVSALGTEFFTNRIQAGETLILNGDGQYDVGNVSWSVPVDVTIKSLSPLISGFRMTNSASNGLLLIKDNCKIDGVKFTDNRFATTQTGRCIVNDVAGNDGIEIINCSFDTIVDVQVYLYESTNTKVNNNKFYNGKWHLNFAGGSHIDVLYNEFDGTKNPWGIGEGVKTIQSANGPIKNMRVMYNYGHDMGRDFLDTTGGLQECTVSFNRIENCGTLIGFGGFDIKTAQSSRTTPDFPNRDNTFSHNLFIDSVFYIKSDFTDDWITTPATTDDVWEYGVSGIHCYGNVYKKTDTGTLQCGFDSGGAVGVSVIGDKYLNGAVFTAGSSLNEAYVSGTTWRPVVEAISFENIVYQHVSDQQEVNIGFIKGAKFHFDDIIIKDRTNAKVFYLENLIDVEFSGQVTVEKQTTFGPSIFWLRPGINEKIVFKDIKANYRHYGDGNEPRLVYGNSPDLTASTDGGVFIHDNVVHGFKALVYWQGSATNQYDLLSVKNNIGTKLQQGLIEWGTLSGRPNIETVYVEDNITDGAPAMNSLTYVNLIDNLIVNRNIEGTTPNYGTVGMLKVVDGAAAQTLGTTPVLLTAWNTNGISERVVVDHTDDYLEAEEDGLYEVDANFSFSGTPSSLVTLHVYKYEAATTTWASSAKVERKLGTAGDVGSCSVKDEVFLKRGDRVAVYGETDGASDAITVAQAQFMMKKL